MSAIKPAKNNTTKKSAQNVGDNLSIVERFFIWLSGADFYVLRLALVEKQKFISLGSVVLITGILAYFTMLFALLDILRLGVSSYFIATIWATCIIFLDRYILASASYEPNILVRVYTYIPRIIVAFLISLVISEPILLKIFNVEVSKEVKSIQIAEIENRTKEILNTGIYRSYLKQIENLEVNLSDYTESLKKVDENLRVLTQQRTIEINGRGGSGTAGYGVNAKKIDEAISVQLTEKTRLQDNINKDQLLKSKIVSLRDSLYSQTSIHSNIDISNYDGILVRIKALSNAQSTNFSLSLAVWLLRLMLMSIELTPVAYKLVSKRSLYDDVKQRVVESQLLLVDLVNNSKNDSYLVSQKMELEHNERLRQIVQEQQEILNRKLISAEVSVLEKAIATWESDRLKNIKKEYIDYFKSFSSSLTGNDIVNPQLSNQHNYRHSTIDPRGVGKSVNEAQRDVVVTSDKLDSSENVSQDEKSIIMNVGNSSKT